VVEVEGRTLYAAQGEAPSVTVAVTEVE